MAGRVSPASFEAAFLAWIQVASPSSCNAREFTDLASGVTMWDVLGQKVSMDYFSPSDVKIRRVGVVPSSPSPQKDSTEKKKTGHDMSNGSGGVNSVLAKPNIDHLISTMTSFIKETQGEGHGDFDLAQLVDSDAVVKSTSFAVENDSPERDESLAALILLAEFVFTLALISAKDSAAVVEDLRSLPKAQQVVLQQRYQAHKIRHNFEKLSGGSSVPSSVNTSRANSVSILRSVGGSKVGGGSKFASAAAIPPSGAVLSRGVSPTSRATTESPAAFRPHSVSDFGGPLTMSQYDDGERSGRLSAGESSDLMNLSASEAQMAQDELKQRYNSLLSQYRNLVSDVEERESYYKSLEEGKATQSHELQEAMGEIERYAREKEELRFERDDLASEKVNLGREMTALQGELVEEREAKRRALVDVAKTQEQVNEQTRKREDLEEELPKATREREVAEAKLGAKKVELQEKEQLISRLNNEIVDQEDDIAALNERIEDLEATNGIYVKEKEAVSKVKNDLERTLSLNLTTPRIISNMVTPRTAATPRAGSTLPTGRLSSQQPMNIIAQQMTPREVSVSTTPTAASAAAATVDESSPATTAPPPEAAEDTAVAEDDTGVGLVEEETPRQQLRDEKQELQIEIESLLLEVETLSNLLNAEKKMRLDAESAREKFEKTHKNEVRRRNEAERKLSSALKEKRALESRPVALESDLKQKDERIAALEQAWQEQVERLTTQASKGRKEKAALAIQLREYEGKIEEQELEVAAAKLATTKAKAAATSARNEATNFAAQLAVLPKQLATSKRELSEWKAKHAEVTKQLKALQREKDKKEKASTAAAGLLTPSTPTTSSGCPTPSFIDGVSSSNNNSHHHRMTRKERRGSKVLSPPPPPQVAGSSNNHEGSSRKGSKSTEPSGATAAGDLHQQQQHSSSPSAAKISTSGRSDSDSVTKSTPNSSGPSTFAVAHGNHHSNTVTVSAVAGQRTLGWKQQLLQLFLAFVVVGALLGLAIGLDAVVINVDMKDLSQKIFSKLTSSFTDSSISSGGGDGSWSEGGCAEGSRSGTCLWKP